MLRLFDLCVRLAEDGVDRRLLCVRFRDRFYVKYSDVRIYGGFSNPYKYGKKFLFCTLAELVGAPTRFGKKLDDTKLVSAEAAVEFLAFEPDRAQVLEGVLVRGLPVVRFRITAESRPTLFVGGRPEYEGETLATVSEVLDAGGLGAASEKRPDEGGDEWRWPVTIRMDFRDGRHVEYVRRNE